MLVSHTERVMQKIMTDEINLTPNAAKRILTLGQKESKPGAMLRISVDGGGCSGFQYAYDFPVYEKSDTDSPITCDGAVVLIDNVSAPFMKGAHIDFVESLGSAMFQIKNPNTTANCGCGNSFAV